MTNKHLCLERSVKGPIFRVSKVMFFSLISLSTQMSQNVSSRAEKELQQLSECLVSQRTDVEVLVTADKERLGHDRLTLQQQKESLSSQVALTGDTVHGFLQELRQDVPTGE